jgi:very-short-patch-repair endonuclease
VVGARSIVTSRRDQELLRRLARHHWVRIHGTPRVTVLVGGATAKQLWTEWLALTATTGTLFEGDALDRNLRAAVAQASASPQAPVAVLVTRDELAQWRLGRNDRISAMVDEGLLEVTEPDAAPLAVTGAQARHAPSAPSTNLDARSAAEAALFEALEATPATAGRFQLNESISVRFGSRAAEIDLLSRADRIAIEIDGVHHFADPDCYRRDRRKDLLLQTQGLLVIRLLAEDVLRDPRDGVNVVCQGLAYRLGDPR